MVKTGQALSFIRAFHDATGQPVLITNPSAVLFVDGAVNDASVTVSTVDTNLHGFAVTLPTLTGGERIQIVAAGTLDTVTFRDVAFDDYADTMCIADLYQYLSAAFGAAPAAIAAAILGDPEMLALFAITGGNFEQSLDGTTITFYAMDDTERTTPLRTFTLNPTTMTRAAT